MLDRAQTVRADGGRRISYTNSLHLVCRPMNMWNCLGGTGARCRSVVSDQWATFLAGVRRCAQNAGAPCIRRRRRLVHGLGRQEIRQVDRRRQPLLDRGHDEPMPGTSTFSNTRRWPSRRIPAVFSLLSPRSWPKLEQCDDGAAARASGGASAARELDHSVTGGGDAAVEHASHALFGRGELASWNEA